MKLPNLNTISLSITIAVSVIFLSSGHALSKSNMSDAEVEEVMLESPAAQVYLSIKKYFPGEAAEWRDLMRDLIQSQKDGTYTSANAIHAGGEIRRRHAPSLLSAPDPLLSELITYQLGSYQIFQNTPDACNRYLMEGAAALSKSERKKLTPVLSDADIVFKAMRAGESTPITRSASTDADWEQFFIAFGEQGFSNHLMDLVIEPDVKNPEMCEAIISFFYVVATSDFDGADRIRAEIAKSLMEF